MLERHPDADAFGGPIRARLEGRTPSACGREDPPITSLDLGPEDTEADMVWGANMAIRRSAFERMGPFDEAVAGHGDEEDWLRALRARRRADRVFRRRRRRSSARSGAMRVWYRWLAPHTTAAAPRG